MVEAIAAGFGHTLRLLLVLFRALPGLVGPVAIVGGVWFIYWPAALIVAGVILVLADLRIGLPATRGKDDK
jgi:hypothetical protein